MEAWLLKAKPAVSVCPTCCTLCMSEDVCCGPDWVACCQVLQIETWHSSRISKHLIWPPRTISSNGNLPLTKEWSQNLVVPAEKGKNIRHTLSTRSHQIHQLIRHHSVTCSHTCGSSGTEPGSTSLPPHFRLMSPLHAVSSSCQI